MLFKTLAFLIILGCFSPMANADKTGSSSGKGIVKNVRDYGAKGDGIADDTAAFQSCHDALKPAGVVYIPAGTYRIKGITCWPGVSFNG